jgi:CPA2 family monovalent cation:H+ antiporter-2
MLAGRIQRIEHRDQMPSEDVAEHTDHVIIGGYGRVGQVIGRLLKAENVPFVALDTNADLASDGAERGEAVFLGDAARGEFLRRAGAAGARAFVVTVNSPRAAERMVAAARKERPDAPVFARARDPAHASRLLKLGAIEVTTEAMEASLQLGARVLEGLGVSDDAVARRLDAMRDQELARISAGEGEKATRS